MALGTITRGDKSGEKPGAPTFVDVLSFPGDDSYPTGGTLGFEASVRAALGQNVTVLGVIGADCGGFVVAYDPAADSLKVYQGDNDNASDGPLVEVPNSTNLSVTTFNLMVLCK